MQSKTSHVVPNSFLWSGENNSRKRFYSTTTCLFSTWRISIVFLYKKQNCMFDKWMKLQSPQLSQKSFKNVSDDRCVYVCQFTWITYSLSRRPSSTQVCWNVTLSNDFARIVLQTINFSLKLISDLSMFKMNKINLK